MLIWVLASKPHEHFSYHYKLIKLGMAFIGRLGGGLFSAMAWETIKAIAIQLLDERGHVLFIFVCFLLLM